jgi:hypothetical protein
MSVLNPFLQPDRHEIDVKTFGAKGMLKVFSTVFEGFFKVSKGFFKSFPGARGFGVLGFLKGDFQEF